MKITLKILLFFLLFLFIFALLAFSIWQIYINPQRGTVKNFEESLPLSNLITSNQAIEDLDFAFDMIKTRQPIWLEKTLEAKSLRTLLTSEYETTREKLENIKEITISELYQELSEIFALLKDGHTKISFYTENLISIDDFTPLYALGNPVAINGIDINKLYDIFKSRFSYEVDISIKKRFFSSYVFREDYLSLVGINTSDSAIYTYKTKEGLKDYVHKFIPHEKSFYPDKEDIKNFLVNLNYSEEEILTITEGSLLESLSPEDVESATLVGDSTDWLWYTIDSKNDIGIFTLTQCIYDDAYKNMVNNFFTDVKKANINNIAVDLRNNGGGNSSVANEFIKHLNVDSYLSWDCAIRFGPFLKFYTNNYYKNQKTGTNFSGNLYILTNPQTYSAAMDFAMLIQDNNLGEIIGEPSSNKPESYGDILFFQLPNSKLQLTVSFKKWYRIDQSKKDLLIEPNYPCPQSEAVSVLYEIIQK